MNPAPPVPSSRDRARPSGISSDRPRGRWAEAPGGVVVAGELGGAEQARNGAGVRPVTVVDPREEPAVGDVVVEDVGDLELASFRRREAADDIERVGPEEVHPDRDEVALGLRGLLLESDDPAVRVELRDAEPFRVGDTVEERPGPRVAALEGLGDVGERGPAQDVVTEDAAERGVADEVPTQPDRLGDALGTGLISVRQVEAEGRAVAEELDDVA